MSPLVDVTNTVNQDSTSDSPQTGSLKKSRVRVQKFFRRVPDAHSQGEADIIKYGKELRVKSEAVAIAMCNTQVSSPIGNISSFQGFSTIAHLYRCTASPLRVPPLPQTTDVLLSQAVQALSLSSHRTQTQSHTQRHFNIQTNSSDPHERRSKKLVSSCNGLPENSGSSIATSALQQCVACGLKFNSLPVLTQHLTRHVYEGLHAAQWLTQAMGLVFSRQSTVESDFVDQVDHGDDAVLTSFSNNQPSHCGY